MSLPHCLPVMENLSQTPHCFPVMENLSKTYAATNTKTPLNFPGGSDGKASAYNEGDLGSIPGLGISPGEGNGNPLQYSCPENPMDGGIW